MRKRLLLVLPALMSLSATNSPTPGIRKEQEKISQEIRAGSNAIAKAIKESVTPPSKDGGCKDDEHNRQSDLCAQWTAADAAKEAADYSFWTLIVSAIGTTLLLITLWETRKTSRAELRAYLSVSMKHLTKWAVGQQAEVHFFIRNGGATPAYNMRWHGGVLVAPFPLEQSPDTFFKLEKGAIPPNYTVQIGDRQEGYVTMDEPLKIAEFADMMSGKSRLLVILTIEYQDTFGRKHITKFCVHTGGPVFANADAAARADGLLECEVEWTADKHHNIAT